MAHVLYKRPAELRLRPEYAKTFRAETSSRPRPALSLIWKGISDSDKFTDREFLKEEGEAITVQLQQDE